MKRRNVLKILGGGAVLAAAGATGFALTRTPHAALAPWEMAGTYPDARLRALSWAVLAPNAHNIQPWVVRLDGADGYTLFADPARQLPMTDPFDRQLTISLGCFLELAAMAAAAEGLHSAITLFPDGEDAADLGTRPIARVVLVPEAGVTPDPLWPHVPHRHSTKVPHDMARPVPPADLARIVAAGQHGTTLGGTVAEADMPFWRKVMHDALALEIDTPRTFRESVDLFRIGKAEVNANPDGLEFHGIGFELLNRAGLFTREGAMDTASVGFKQGRAQQLANCDAAMGMVWMVTQGNSRHDQIAAGRDWLRVNLAATAAGVGFHPMSQAIQEYPEMQALFDTVHQRLAPEGGTVQMLARIGYAPRGAHTPRWPLEAKLMKG